MAISFNKVGGHASLKETQSSNDVEIFRPLEKVGVDIIGDQVTFYADGNPLFGGPLQPGDILVPGQTSTTFATIEDFKAALSDFFEVGDGGGGGSSPIAHAGIAWVEVGADDSKAQVGRPDLPFGTWAAASDATAALPGRKIALGLGTHEIPPKSKILANTTIIGLLQPLFDNEVTAGAYPLYNYSAPTKLVGGTRLAGQLVLDDAIRDNLKIYNLGVDVGSHWVNTENNGVEAEGVLVQTTGGSLNGLNLMRGFEIKDVTVLQSSEDVLKHAVCIQGCYMPLIEDVKVWGGFAGIVTKNVGAIVRGCRAYSCGQYAIIDKNNPYGYAFNTLIEGCYCEGTLIISGDIINGFTYSGKGGGIKIETPSGVDVIDGVKIVSCYVRNTDYGVMCLEGANNVTILDVHVKLRPGLNGNFNIGFNILGGKNAVIHLCSSEGGKIGVQVGGTGPAGGNRVTDNVKVLDCHVTGTTSWPYYINGTDAARPAIIRGCTASDCGASAMFGDYVYGRDNTNLAYSGTLNQS